MSALRAAGLRISIGGSMLVEGVDLSVEPGECVAIVGESGAGKSLTALALLGLTPEGARVHADELAVAGVDVRGYTDAQWRAVRGSGIGLVSQDALVSLDPLRRIAAEVGEPLALHGGRMPRAERRAKILRLLADVAMPEPGRRADQYPHELSGGIRQRALIASALAAQPAVLIADEPTTALDATVQARVLGLLREIADRGIAVLFISHDFTAVERVADRVVVMQSGRVVETGTAAEVLGAPRHPHTQQLVAASRHAARAAASDSPPILVSGRGLSKAFDRPAVRDVSFDLAQGRTLGVVGESGSGKTTLARMLVGIETPDSGAVLLDGRVWQPRTARDRRRVQLVHQNPRGALDPRWTIGRSIREALEAGGVGRAERPARCAELLREVDLDPALARRRPGELSGGQRQRAAIARALAVGPEVLVLDEPVSALDPSVRERVLALLTRLQHERGLTMVLVSHDLDVVAGVADDVIVMQDGAVVESGPVSTVFGQPRHPFTRELLAATRRGAADQSWTSMPSEAASDSASDST